MIRVGMISTAAVLLALGLAGCNQAHDPGKVQHDVARATDSAAEADAKAGAPALGREMPNEGEAIVEAFRAGVNFYTISEFRTRAELASSRGPVLKKEAVRNSNHSS